jgi:excisionase family DNA binding protein
MADRVWLTPEDVAERLQVSVKTLERWRSAKNGPRFGRRGQVIRYRLDDVDEWMRGDDS